MLIIFLCLASYSSVHTEELCLSYYIICVYVNFYNHILWYCDYSFCLILYCALSVVAINSKLNTSFHLERRMGVELLSFTLFPTSATYHPVMFEQLSSVCIVQD